MKSFRKGCSAELCSLYVFPAQTGSRSGNAAPSAEGKPGRGLRRGDGRERHTSTASPAPSRGPAAMWRCDGRSGVPGQARDGGEA